MSTLWIALRLPNLPLESLASPADSPAVVFERHGNRRLVLCTNAPAARAGIGTGMEVGAATALAPELTALERKPAAERAALASLASAAYRFSGSVTVRPAAPAPSMHTLWCEVGSSLRLFKGIDPLLAQLRAALDALGYTCRIGMAPTLECASLLADSAETGSAAKPFAQLRSLPLSLLEVAQETREALTGSGLRTIGEVLDLPINELAMRFGQSLPDYLGRITGRLPDTRRFYRPPDKYQRRFEFDAELESLEALLFPLRRLLVEFQHYLIARDTGVREFSIELEHPQDRGAEARPTQLSVGMGAASRDAAHLLLLLRERFERTPMPAPVRAITLHAERFAPPRVLQRALFETRTAADEEWQAVLDRLRVRLGAEAVHSLGLNDDYRPEKSWCRLPPGEEKDVARYFPGIAENAPRQRPLWLLPVPRPLSGIPDCVSGPERLESGWWDGLDAMRDYYQAKTAAGARLWVYRDRRSGNWFLQGLWS